MFFFFLKQSISKVPKENCEINPHKICNKVFVQVPRLKMENVCEMIPREICTTERVQPKLVKVPVIRKMCTKLKNEITTEEKDEESHVINEIAEETYEEVQPNLDGL